KVETTGFRAPVSQMVNRMQEGFREAGDALREAGETMTDESRKVALTLVNHAQDNVVWSFDALRETIQAGSFAEAVKVQQQAMTELFRRSVRQFREVSEIVGDSSTKTIRPISRFVTSLRDTRRAA
ncbi:MAG: phasin family protein, partial [Alphaproteobacteria bacterium]